MRPVAVYLAFATPSPDKIRGRVVYAASDTGPRSMLLEKLYHIPLLNADTTCLLFHFYSRKYSNLSADHIRRNGYWHKAEQIGEPYRQACIKRPRVRNHKLISTRRQIHLLHIPSPATAYISSE